MFFLLEGDMKSNVRHIFLYIVIFLFFSAAALFILYTANVASPRLETSQLSSLREVPDHGPFLLTDGQLYEDEEGQFCFAFSFHNNCQACLFFPRAVDAVINGESHRQQHSFIPLSIGEDYTVVIRSKDRSFSYVSNAVYYGTQEHVMDFLSTYAQVNAFIRGLCFTILLFCVILLFYKRSEKYLLWLAILCFFRGSYTRVSLFLKVVTWIPGLAFLEKGYPYMVIHEMVTVFLQYKIMESFVPVKIGKFPFPCYTAIAAVPVLLVHSQPIQGILTGLVFFGVLYLCYLICFLRLPATAVAERDLLLAAWVLTVVLRLFDELCDLGVLPSGYINLQVPLRGVTSMLFVLAFFAVVGKRFAQKFQEADDLNLNLEESIRQKTRQQTVFIRSLLHNLKTPLFSLSGYSDMALASLDRNPDQARQYMEKAREKAIFAGDLLDHIFLATQMDADMIKMQFSPVNIGELLRAVADTPTTGAENKALQVALDLPDNVYLQGDPLYLRQAFQNLLDNARLNTPEGGTIRIQAAVQNNLLSVHVTDTGCGIAPEDREKIFEAYYSNRNGKRPSSGLGLYITSEIIKRHHGQIHVESEVNKGSDFIVQLPVS